jgi:hypothetical protein
MFITVSARALQLFSERGLLHGICLEYSWKHLRQDFVAIGMDSGIQRTNFDLCMVPVVNQMNPIYNSSSLFILLPDMTIFSYNSISSKLFLLFRSGFPTKTLDEFYISLNTFLFYKFSFHSGVSELDEYKTEITPISDHPIKFYCYSTLKMEAAGLSEM